MKEIGGYLELEHLPGNGFYPELIALNSGRGALLYLLKAKKITKLYIPYYLCDSVSGICRKHGYDYSFYHIGNDLLPSEEISPNEGEAVYIVNYFGQLDECAVLSLKEKYGSIILDNVQAFFCKPIPGVDTLYSCRKFFGVPDGGYLSTDAKIIGDLPTDISGDRMLHLTGRLEECASKYYSVFKEKDAAFADYGIRHMSKVTKNLLAAVDYAAVSDARRKNFDVLHSILGDYNLMSPKNNEGPYVYPLKCRDGMKIKKALAEKKIFVATLWPEVLDLPGSVEHDLTENILPLPCDQRYEQADMEYMSDVIKGFL